MSKILIIEDEVAIADLEKDYLELSGFEVVIENAGDTGLERALSEKFDLVVLDLMLPGMDGFEVCKKIREEQNIPILMVSAKQLPQDKHKGFAVGTDDYITKPIDDEEMLFRIKALLRRAQIATDRKIIVGDVIIDYDSLTVTRGDEVQELPQKEFLLLYKLLSYPGKIFTRIQLMDEIWGADSATGWETVTVHIGRLRKRFEGWSEFSIESVRGLGYKAVKRV